MMKLNADSDNSPSGCGIRLPDGSTLRIERLVVSLRMTGTARFHFLHGYVLHGLVTDALQLAEDALPETLIPFACEAGRVHFGPGDEYHFGLTVLGEAQKLVPALGSGLSRIGSKRYSPGTPSPCLDGNFEVSEIHVLPDAGDPEPMADTANPSDLCLRFLSPLRLARADADKRPGKTNLDGTCFPAGHFLTHLWRRLFFLTHGRSATHEEQAARCPAVPDDVTTCDLKLLWIDLPCKGRDGHAKGRPGGWTTGGVLGSVRFRNVPAAWLEMLQLGQQVHVGEKTSLGFGRYWISGQGDPADDPFRPALTIPDSLAAPQRLAAALAHFHQAGTAAGIDGVTPADASAEAEEVVRSIRHLLESGEYRPKTLRGIVLEKPHGGLRALAVPTVADRCVQRAAVEILGPAIDTLLEDCSFAYRKGFSRTQAASAIQRAHDAGYRYVLDADIEGFFDAVAWDRLRAKLEALYPLDGIAGLIMEWVAAPVIYEGRTIVRTQGLPQGSPISPLLANLFLDEFDEELLGRDYRLVRYADDFIVLCRDLSEAERARDDARAALEALGLRLHPDKTSVTSFDAGFSYLGYLFCRSTVVERKKMPHATSTPAGALEVGALSWLAQVPFKRAAAIAANGQCEPPGRPETAPLQEVRPTHRFQANPVYLSGYGTRVWKQGGRLVVEEQDGDKSEIALREISHVVMIGRVGMTMPALLALARHGIPVYACKRSGELDVPLVQQTPDWRLWAAQGAKADDEKLCLDISRAIVQAKLHNSATLAVRFAMAEARSTASRIRLLERSCLNQPSLDGLRGLEGRGAALYFGMLRDSLPQEWGFKTRERHPPPDPVNALLSLGYTLLYNHVSSALEEAGMNPRIGFFHQPRGAYHALACDLQEEFRHLVDALVWSLIRRREICPNDFDPSADGRYPCLLSTAARRHFIKSFEKRLASSFQPDGWAQKITYREFIYRQAVACRDVVQDRQPAYCPLRIHA
jgi:CRISPR-associated protein Cas1